MKTLTGTEQQIGQAEEIRRSYSVGMSNLLKMAEEGSAKSLAAGKGTPEQHAEAREKMVTAIDSILDETDASWWINTANKNIQMVTLQLRMQGKI